MIWQSNFKSLNKLFFGKNEYEITIRKLHVF